MKKKLFWVCLLALLLLPGQAMAFSLSLSPMDQAIFQGDMATVDINLTTDGLESLYGFDFDLTFDPTILGFDSFSTTLFNPADPLDLAYDYVGGFNLFDGLLVFDAFWAGGLPLSGNITLASLTFSGIGLGTSLLDLTGTLDLGNMDPTTFEFILDPASAQGSIMVAEAPAPIPEPGTWMLIGVGLVGLVGMRRKFSKA